MKRTLKSFLALSLAFITAFSLFGCSKKAPQTPVNPEDFRITAYVVGEWGIDFENFDKSHFNQITDIILIGVTTFDEEGNLNFFDNYHQCVKFLKENMNENQRLHLNVLGPGYQTDSQDWSEQMADKAQRHSNAFLSGKLEANIKAALEEYDFDGVFFDYEYPLEQEPWDVYNNFIVSLDKALGDKYTIGMALAAWNANQSPEAIAATDYVTVMSYDLWDKKGNHATLDIAKDDIKLMEKKGYDKARLDVGIPFYARPTTEEAYWYNYKDYYNKIDENGLYQCPETNLTFSFNTYDAVYEKTLWAIDKGVGGAMVWHYESDLPATNEKSLFNAIYEAKQYKINPTEK